jgi:DNA-binding CsgD family transcriptional regulator
MAQHKAAVPRLPKLEALNFVYFADMPDAWDSATNNGPVGHVLWEREAKMRLARLNRELPKMEGAHLDLIEREANRFLSEPVTGYRRRHRKMYLPQVLRSIGKEVRRRSSTLTRKNLPKLVSLSSLPEPMRDAIQSANLTDMQQKCYVLKHAYSKSHREIADLLGIHHSTVQEHLTQAKNRLASAHSSYGKHRS